jgi:hypothetical protein
MNDTNEKWLYKKNLMRICVIEWLKGEKEDGKKNENHG